jgi:hypothetical protein
MVKGNWERRAELVAARRLEERANKANKAAGAKQFASGESVATKLSRDSQLQDGGARIEAWLEQNSPELMCHSWLRLEKCTQKKCKYTHETNIAHLSDLNCDPQEERPTEPLCAGPIFLNDVPKKDYSRLRFIAVNGACVYDHLFPDVWSQWSAQRAVVTAALDKSKLPPIAEAAEASRTRLKSDGEDSAECGDEELDGSRPRDSAMDDLSQSVQGLILSGPDFSAFFLDPDHQAIAPFASIITSIMLQLNAQDAGKLALANKAMHAQSLKTEIFRLRRREGMAAYVVEQSKAKKQEKKKKAKQANVKKDSKKDAFARGGNSH